MRLLDRNAAELPEWLLDEGSLTERLLWASEGNFRVERLSQSWRRPLLSEALLLGLAPGQWALVREVVLRCFDEPWVYARSVIPADTLSGRLRRLRRLQNESLGALLFKHPKLAREAFEVALLPAGSSYLHPEFRQTRPCWARRSCFSLYNHRLLVSEVFLEQFQA
ncbi:MAG: chorismate lyase [Halieaceae bacterium]|jgi:chorismate--pyruvate lyase|nr:chorismate lyase [Halieaceae bacterium]